MSRVSHTMLRFSGCGWLAFFTFVIVLPSNTSIAAPFQNLDFERSTVLVNPTNPATSVSATAAFPGWIAKENDAVVTQVLGVPAALDETSIALVSAAYSGFPAEAPPQGNYAVQLYGVYVWTNDFPTTASISQTGDIPAGSESIRFLIENPPKAGNRPLANPLFSVNGIRLAVYPIVAFGSAMQWAADISPYAGTTATITFAATGVPGSFSDEEDLFDLDAISFSTQPIPEPLTTTEVNLMSGILLLGRRRRS